MELKGLMMRRVIRSHKNRAEGVGRIDRLRLRSAQTSTRGLTLMATILVITVLTSFVAVADYAGLAASHQDAEHLIWRPNITALEDSLFQPG